MSQNDEKEMTRDEQIDYIHNNVVLDEVKRSMQQSESDSNKFTTELIRSR